MSANNKGQNVANAPLLRFPEFKDEWNIVKVSDLLEFYSTNSYSWDQLDFEVGEIFNLHYGMIHNGLPTMMNAKENILPFVKEKPKNYTICKEGDVAFADASEDTNDVAKCIEFTNCDKKQIICGLHTIHGRDKLGITELGYKGYAFSSKAFHDQVKKLAQGTKIYSISAKTFSECFVGIPSNKEQQKIAKLLSLLDRRIEIQRSAIEKLKSLKSAIVDKLLAEKKECQTIRLGDICSITTGKLDANAMDENGIYPFFTCAEIPFKINKYAFDCEALMISGNGANLGYIHYYKGKFNAYQRTYVLKDFSVNINYVKFLLDRYLHRRIEQEKNTGNTPYIKLSTLTDMQLYIPVLEKDIQKTIDICCSISNYLDISKKILTMYNKQKQFLLNKMFI